MINGFNDATCPKCGERVSWTGKLTDRPPCECGHQVDKAQLESAEAKVEAEIKKIQDGKDMKKRVEELDNIIWVMRTAIRKYCNNKKEDIKSYKICTLACLGCPKNGACWQQLERIADNVEAEVEK